jgi:hypothetical protein
MSLFSGDAFPGVLTLTTQRLLFMPAVQDDEGVAYSWELPVEEIHAVELDPMMGRLLLSTDGPDQEVMGIEMEAFRDRLTELLAARDAGELEFDDSQSRVLLRGIIDCYLNKLMAARGEVEVTTRRLTFHPARKLETRFWGDKQIDVALSEITDVKVVGVRQRLEVTMGKETQFFRGDLVPRLHAILDSVRRKEGAAPDDEVFDGFPVQYFQGPLSQPGDMVISRKRIQFAPSGRLEQMVGSSKRLDIPLGDITRMEVHGVLDRRLVVNVGEAHHVFSLQHPMERLAEVSDLLLDLERPEEPLVPATGLEERTMVVNRLLDRWKEEVPGLNLSDMLLLGPVLHLPRKPGVRRGWLVLNAEVMAFLPVGGPAGGETPFSLPISHLAPDDVQRPPEGEIHVSTGNVVLRFRARGGQLFADNFWRIWKDELQHTEERQEGLDGLAGTVGPDGFVNRRETYRARIPGGIEVNVLLPTEEEPGFMRTIDGRMRNISLGGCAISIDEAPDFSVPVTVEIKYGGAVARVVGVEAYVIQRPGSRRGIYGFSFQEMDYVDAQIVREIVMQLQREDLARRAEIRPT